MDERLVRKREEEEQPVDDDVDGGDQIPPELMQLAGLLLQSFLAGDRDSVEALYEMYHEPDKFVERQRNTLREMLKELLADGTITAEEAKQLNEQLKPNKGANDSAADDSVANSQSVQTQSDDNASNLQIPPDTQKVANPKGKTLHEILGITR